MTQISVATTVPDLDDVRIIAFAESITNRITVKGGRLQEYAEMESFRGKAKTIDQYGAIELQEVNGLYPKIEEGEIAHDRRFLTWKRYARTIFVDEARIKEIVEDPKGKYAGQLVDAFNRLKDRLILNAVLADVTTGENGDTTLTAAEDDVLTVDATGGLTYEKILELSENYIDNSVPVDTAGPGEFPPILTITGKENTALIKEQEFSDQDYSEMFTKDGLRMKFVGDHKLMMFGAKAKNGSNPIVPVNAAGTVRYNISMVKGAVTMGIGLEPTLRIDYLPERHNTVAIKFSVGIGTVRNQGELCQILTTTIPE